MSNFKFHSSLGIRSLGILIVPVSFMNKSFTLLEIIVVVVIAGIIATFAVSNYHFQREITHNKAGIIVARRYLDFLKMEKLRIGFLPVTGFFEPYSGVDNCGGAVGVTADWCYNWFTINFPPPERIAVVARRNLPAGDPRASRLLRIYDNGTIECVFSTDQKYCLGVPGK